MILHFDCFAGASGDMILAALIDAGAGLEAIQKQISKLDADAEIEAREVHRSGIRALQLRVTGKRTPASYPAIRDLIREGGLDEPVERTALAALETLAVAEAEVHGTTVEEVHFHELSGIDTIVDLVGVAAALELLQIDAVSCSPVATGWGTVSSEHGELPVPAPATLELLKGVPTYGIDIKAELITPTGAAILRTIVTTFGPIPAMTVDSVGYGAGSRELEVPNVLRAVVGVETRSELVGVDEIVVEANLDDMNPEFFEYVSERLYAAGANDVWITPAIGKKGRPASVLSVLAPPPLADRIREIVLSETSTIGIRTTRVEKFMLERRWEEVKVEGRPVRIKVSSSGGRVVNVAPEYSDCAEVARLTGLPIKEVWRRALSATTSPSSGPSTTRG